MSDKVVVLVIDDEQAIRKLLKVSMPDNFQVVEAETGKEGLRLTATNNPDIILLDLGLPDIDGVELTRQVREFCQVPIIVLSARGRDDDKVAALDSGANDYLTKPFSIAELHARMRVALRTSSSSPTQAEHCFGHIRINIASREVFKDDELIHLTPTEYKILIYVVQNAGRVLTHKQLLNEIWGAAYAHQTQYLRVYMGQLRLKLESDPARPQHFLTEPGVGYRFRSGVASWFLSGGQKLG